MTAALRKRLESVELVGAAVRPYDLPFEAPIGGYARRGGALLVLVDRQGRVGLGDAAPWPPSADRIAACTAELRARTARLDALAVDLESAAPAVQAAIELALLDLLAKSDGCSVATLLAGAFTSTAASSGVAVSALVSGPDDATRAVAAGFRTLKVKFTGRELSHIAAVRNAVGPDVRLRVDANRSVPAEAVSGFLAALADLGVELVEEPGDASVSDSPIPVFLDESVRTLGALDRALATGRPSGLIVKPALSGILAGVHLAHAAMDRGLDVIVTHSLESAVGRAGAAHVAAALGRRVYADGLADPRWATDDVVTPLIIERGELDLSAIVGLGVSLNAATSPHPPGPTDLPHPVRSAALGRPNHAALVADDRTLTWRGLDRAAAQHAWLLTALGVRPGDVVGIPTAFTAAAVVALHGVTLAGAIAAPLGPDGLADLRSASLNAILLGAHTVGPELSSLTTIVVGDTSALPEAPERFAGPDDDQFIIFTSGTTGTPKAVRLGALQIALSAFGSAMRLGHATDDRWLLCLPLHHVGGLMVLLRSAFGAITTVMPGRFDAATVAHALDTGDITVASLVPMQLEWVLDARPERSFPPSVRVVLVGGAPTSQRLRDRCARLSLPISLSWGMTEAASQIATFPPGQLNASAAPLLPFARVERLPDGRARVLGPTVRGAFDTRDLISIDIDGAVRVTGRADDTIISGGLNLDPAELEAALARHPAVTQVVVVGAPDATWGERPIAAYTGTASPDELARFGRDVLPGRKVPSAFIQLDAMPLTELGKVSRPLVKRALLALAPSSRSTSSGESP